MSAQFPWCPLITAPENFKYRVFEVCFRILKDLIQLQKNILILVFIYPLSIKNSNWNYLSISVPASSRVQAMMILLVLRLIHRREPCLDLPRCGLHFLPSLSWQWFKECAQELDWLLGMGLQVLCDSIIQNGFFFLLLVWGHRQLFWISEPILQGWVLLEQCYFQKSSQDISVCFLPCCCLSSWCIFHTKR